MKYNALREESVKFEFCWEHKGCGKDCLVRETGTVFCWRLARVERLCHPSNCEACTYKKNWFAREYDLQEFIAKHDRRRDARPFQRVLAIDDEPNFLSVLEDSIVDEGYKCFTAIEADLNPSGAINNVVIGHNMPGLIPEKA